MQETLHINTSPVGTTLNFDIHRGHTQIFSANLTSNFTVNIRYDNNIPLGNWGGNTTMLTLSLFYRNAARTFYANQIRIDGNIVQPEWVLKPTSGSSNSWLEHEFTLARFGNVWGVLGSSVRYARDPSVRPVTTTSTTTRAPSTTTTRAPNTTSTTTISPVGAINYTYRLMSHWDEVRVGESVHFILTTNDPRGIASTPSQPWNLTIDTFAGGSPSFWIGAGGIYQGLNVNLPASIPINFITPSYMHDNARGDRYLEFNVPILSTATVSNNMWDLRFNVNIGTRRVASAFIKVVGALTPLSTFPNPYQSQGKGFYKPRHTDFNALIQVDKYQKLYGETIGVIFSTNDIYANRSNVYYRFSVTESVMPIPGVVPGNLNTPIVTNKTFPEFRMMLTPNQDAVNHPFGTYSIGMQTTQVTGANVAPGVVRLFVERRIGNGPFEIIAGAAPISFTRPDAPRTTIDWTNIPYTVGQHDNHFEFGNTTKIDGNATIALTYIASNQIDYNANLQLRHQTLMSGTNKLYINSFSMINVIDTPSLFSLNWRTAIAEPMLKMPTGFNNVTATHYLDAQIRRPGTPMLGYGTIAQIANTIHANATAVSVATTTSTTSTTTFAPGLTSSTSTTTAAPVLVYNIVTDWHEKRYGEVVSWIFTTNDTTNLVPDLLGGAVTPFTLNIIGDLTLLKPGQANQSRIFPNTQNPIGQSGTKNDRYAEGSFWINMPIVYPGTVSNRPYDLELRVTKSGVTVAQTYIKVLALDSAAPTPYNFKFLLQADSYSKKYNESLGLIFTTADRYSFNWPFRLRTQSKFTSNNTFFGKNYSGTNFISSIPHVIDIESVQEFQVYSPTGYSPHPTINLTDPPGVMTLGLQANAMPFASEVYMYVDRLIGTNTWQEVAFTGPISFTFPTAVPPFRPQLQVDYALKRWSTSVDATDKTYFFIWWNYPNDRLLKLNLDEPSPATSNLLFHTNTVTGLTGNTIEVYGPGTATVSSINKRAIYEVFAGRTAFTGLKPTLTRLYQQPFATNSLGTLINQDVIYYNPPVQTQIVPAPVLRTTSTTSTTTTKSPFPTTTTLPQIDFVLSVVCVPGQNAGNIQIGNITGGVPPYRTYSPFDGSTTFTFAGQRSGPAPGTVNSYPAVANGLWDVRVYDNANNYRQKRITVDCFGIPTTTTTTALIDYTVTFECNQNNNLANITISNPTGGVGPYRTYNPVPHLVNWTSNGQTSIFPSSFTNIANGFWATRVYDNLGNFREKFITVACGTTTTTTAALTTTTTTAALPTTTTTVAQIDFTVTFQCNQHNNLANITISNPTGGVGPYLTYQPVPHLTNFTLNGQTSVSSGSPVTFYNYEPIVWTLRVYDNLGNFREKFITVACGTTTTTSTTTAAPTTTTTTTTTLAPIDFTVLVTCDPDGSGNITISNPTGGVGPYRTYDPVPHLVNWTSNGQISVFPSSFTNIANGYWAVRVYDNLGNFHEKFVTVSCGTTTTTSTTSTSTSTTTSTTSTSTSTTTSTTSTSTSTTTSSTSTTSTTTTAAPGFVYTLSAPDGASVNEGSSIRIRIVTTDNTAGTWALNSQYPAYADTTGITIDPFAPGLNGTQDVYIPTNTVPVTLNIQLELVKGGVTRDTIIITVLSGA